MIFDDVIAKEPNFNEYFFRARHENCDLIYLNKIFSQQIDRMLGRTVIYLFSLNKEAKPSLLYIMITLLDLNLVIMI